MLLYPKVKQDGKLSKDEVLQEEQKLDTLINRKQIKTNVVSSQPIQGKGIAIRTTEDSDVQKLAETIDNGKWHITVTQKRYPKIKIPNVPA